MGAVSWQTPVEYGTCPCGSDSHYEARTVEVRIRFDDEQVLLTDTPQGLCQQCGSRVYKLADIELLETVMHTGSSARAD